MNSVSEKARFHGSKLLGVVLLGTAAATVAAPAKVTWNPEIVIGATGTPFTFDNITLQTFSSIDVTGGNAFTTQGFLNLFSFQNGATLTQLPNVGVTGGSPYSLYVSFTGTGAQSPSVPSIGTFNTLNYTLFGAVGVTTFVDSNSDGIFEASGGAATTLGTGSLIPGTGLTTVSPSGASTASANTLFVPDGGSADFFADGAPFLKIVTAFTATGTVTNLIPLGGGDFRLSINGGGGNATISPIPEPATYAMMLGGLFVVGFAARRRRLSLC